jgi:lipopolysaccharide/colanic/teichoic acid biosynthesis glycosyltransferase
MLLPAELKNRDQDGPSTADVLYSWFKRSLDILLSSVGLLVMAPVFVVIAAVIKVDSRGPVLYGQERIGLNRRRSRGTRRSTDERRKRDTLGRPFKIWKFRTMIVDAEKDTGAVWAQANDSRITRVGKILRNSRLDEFPQLWNVLRGDMCLVGPRPERPSFVLSLSESLPDYPKRCFALPGITGLAQVKSKYDTSIETVNRKLAYDLYYVRHGRIMLDFKIMVATLKVMARGEGAH